MDSQAILQQLAGIRVRFKFGDHLGAIRELKRMEEDGSGNAAHFLSLVYEDGFRCGFFSRLLGYGNQDKQIAESYRRKAVERGSSQAQFELACAYFYGPMKESGVIKEQAFEKAFMWAALCADSQEYSEVSFMAMSLLSELYAKGLGCTRNYFHAVLLRVIANVYNRLLEYQWEYVEQSFDIPPELEEIAKEFAVVYFEALKYQNKKLKVAQSDSPVFQMFLRSVPPM